MASLPCFSHRVPSLSPCHTHMHTHTQYDQRESRHHKERILDEIGIILMALVHTYQHTHTHTPAARSSWGSPWQRAEFSQSLLFVWSYFSAERLPERFGNLFFHLISTATDSIPCKACRIWAEHCHTHFVDTAFVRELQCHTFLSVPNAALCVNNGCTTQCILPLHQGSQHFADHCLFHRILVKFLSLVQFLLVALASWERITQ